MNKYEISELDNCYVCGEYMGTFKNELTVSTGYSERTIKEIIGKDLIFFVDLKKFNLINLLENFTESTLSNEALEGSGICQMCYIKFNEYDEHSTIAQQILSELNSMLTIRESYVEIKAEIKDVDVEKVIVYNEYDVNTVEVPDFSTDQEYIIQELEPKQEISDEDTIKIKTEKKRSSYIKKDKDAGFIVTMINGQKHFTCEVCRKHFLNRSRLRTHRLIHSTERNYVCASCGAKFKTLNCLKNHSRLHSNVFFNCDLCDSRFKGKHELKCHMEAIHLMRKDHVW